MRSFILWFTLQIATLCIAEPVGSRSSGGYFLARSCGYRAPSNRIILQSFSRHVSRVLDWKQSSQDLNRNPYEMSAPSVESTCYATSLALNIFPLFSQVLSFFSPICILAMLIDKRERQGSRGRHPELSFIFTCSPLLILGAFLACQDQ